MDKFKKHTINVFIGEGIDARGKNWRVRKGTL